MKSLLVKALGFSATLIHGDTLVLDRWRWLRERLGPGEGKTLLDVGCGTGAFTIGAALRGYQAIGLSWDSRNQLVAQERASLCGAARAVFQVVDVRTLDQRQDFNNHFDVVICLETIEHILDDQKLLSDIARALKPGGRLFLTTPNIDYRAITASDNGPFSTYEDGWHVRKGYSEDRLRELAETAGFAVHEISWCSGFLSQKLTGLMRVTSRTNHYLSWSLTFPLRILPPMFDKSITKMLGWPLYSICLSAVKTSAVHS